MKILEKTEFGSPILRQVAKQLTQKEIKSDKLQKLIENMQYTLIAKNFGVGLAAPQVGESLALFVIELQPTKHRPNIARFSANLINPKIISEEGKKVSAWEGCLSSGKQPIMAKVPRYKKIEVEYLDETGERQTQKFEGLAAQVIQHEVDHLQGILFVDRVEDTKTYASFSEYQKLVEAKHA